MRPSPNQGDKRKRYCNGTCRKRALRAGVGGAEVAPVADVARRPLADVSVVRVTQAALVAAGRWETVQGQLAMTLAQRLDAGRDTGSAVAAMAKALTETLDRALADSSPGVDLVDELQRKRAARLAGASP